MQEKIVPGKNRGNTSGQTYDNHHKTNLEKFVQRSQKGIFPVTKIAAYIGAAMLALLVIIPLIDITMRRLLNKPLAGSYELSEFALGLMVFFTLAYCAVKGIHIVVDVATARLPEKARDILDSIILTVSWVTMAIISWQLLVRAFMLKADNDISTILYIPIYPFVLIAGLGCTLLTLVFFTQSLDKLFRR